ncbi:MAG: hypothetical protein V7785_21665, partial [Bermanella sp.]
PWEINWPAYYWADGQKHTLLLTASNSQGDEVSSLQSTAVTISTDANSALQFNAGTDGAEIQDEDSLSIGFHPFSSASRYQVEYDGLVINTVNTDIELTELNVGTYDIRYRAIYDYSESATLTGPLSEKATITVKAPTLPVLNDPTVVLKDGGYEMTLTWENVAEGDSYDIEVRDISTSELVHQEDSVISGSLVISGLEKGAYEWSLTRTNSMGQQVISETLQANVGIFKTLLESSDDFFGKKIFASQNGGYFVLGQTTMYDSRYGDDWLVKLNEKGEIEWEYVIQHAGSISEIKELDDGFLYGVGATPWADRKGYAIKINPQEGVEDRVVWQKEYTRDVANNFWFKSFVNIEEELFISAGQRICDTHSCDEFFLYKLNRANGDEINQYKIESPEGKLITSTGGITLLSNSELALAVTIGPDDEDESLLKRDGGVISLDLNGQVNWAWDAIGEYEFAYGEYITRTPWGDLMLTGLAHMGTGVMLAYIREDGTSGETHRLERSSYEFDAPVFDDSENAIRFVWTNGDTRCGELWATNKNGYTKVLQDLCDLNISSNFPRSITSASDGGFVLMFVSNDPNGTKSTYIMKTDIQGEM